MLSKQFGTYFDLSAWLVFAKGDEIWHPAHVEICRSSIEYCNENPLAMMFGALPCVASKIKVCCSLKSAEDVRAAIDCGCVKLNDDGIAGACFPFSTLDMFFKENFSIYYSKHNRFCHAIFLEYAVTHKESCERSTYVAKRIPKGFWGCFQRKEIRESESGLENAALVSNLAEINDTVQQFVEFAEVSKKGKDYLLENIYSVVLSMDPSQMTNVAKRLSKLLCVRKEIASSYGVQLSHQIQLSEKEISNYFLLKVVNQIGELCLN
jgi:hypothetical protein